MPEPRETLGCRLFVAMVMHLVFLIVTATTAPTAPIESYFTHSIVLHPWERRQRRLRVQTGVSWGVTGIGVVGASVSLATLVGCARAEARAACDTFVPLVTLSLFSALLASAIVPAIVYTDHLVEHRTRRPANLSRFRITTSGFEISF